MPRVSVIIPAHNGDHFISQAIQSVLRQTYRDYEIIVVDDGSTDHTRVVIQPFNERIRYVYQDNQGVASARNRGIELAQGELVTFLDQDDFFMPNKLESQVLCFDTRVELGIVSSGWCTVDQERKWIANVEPWKHLPQLDTSAWIVWKPVFPGALMIKQAWLKQAGGFDPQFQQTSDVDLMLRLAYLGCPSAWVKQVAVCYRQHADNTSRSVNQQVKDLEAVLDNFFGQTNLPNTIGQLEKQSRYQSLVWTAWRLYSEGYLTEMIIPLEESLKYRSGTWTEACLNWSRAFKQYGKEQGKQVDVLELTQLPQWQMLIQRCMTYLN